MKTIILIDCVSPTNWKTLGPYMVKRLNMVLY